MRNKKLIEMARHKREHSSSEDDIPLRDLQARLRKAAYDNRYISENSSSAKYTESEAVQRSSHATEQGAMSSADSESDIFMSVDETT